MVGVHVLIGLGEGIISASTVAAVLAVRPDLVRGARDLVPRLTLAARSGVPPATPATPAGPTAAGPDRP
jgi:cobalt/nickel transport system permease protein